MKRNRLVKSGITALALVVVLVSSVMLTSCSDSGVTSAENSIEYDANISAEVSYETPDFDSDDLKTDYEDSEVATIEFDGDSIKYTGVNASVSGSVITILNSGVYYLSGSSDDGQVVVEAVDEGTVYLILDNLSLSSSSSAPIYISNAEKTIITLAEGTDNYLSDGTDRVFADIEDEEPDSVLFSEDDLTINGEGSLTVEANYKHGIVSKDDLIIISGDITVNAISDAIRGRDSIVVAGGTLNLIAGSDGMQSNNDDDPEKGFIQIEGGTINITSDNDGIQAETSVYVTEGEINILAGGGTQNIVVDEDVNEQQKDSMYVEEETESTKGIKAGVYLMISGGDININSHDDALHSDDIITIEGGIMELSSDDDGIHAENTIVIDNGYINITNCNEGIESKVIVVNDGEIKMRASDDGFNASDGSASTMMPGQEVATEGVALYINGGYMYITSNADSVDSNGIVEMTGGVLVVNGPESYTNGALDSDGQFTISGGFLVAVGSSGMAESPDNTSEQNTILYLYESVQAAGSMIYIESEDGEQILAFEPTKVYQSIAFSSPDLKEGETYTLYSGGSMDSTETDGLYAAGNYSNGTEVSSFKLTDSLTVIGTQSRGGGMTGGGPGRR